MANVQVETTKKVPAVPDRDELVSRLDELLEKYLVTLDAYQKAQQQLTKQLSSGYMSLAQANFTNNAHTRYGRDYYDERMQALRKVTISEDAEKVSFAIEPLASKAPAPASASETEKPSPSKDDSPDPKDPDTETPETPGRPAPENEKTEPEKKAPPRDPIRWFGVLVPPALRAAQTSFVDAVEGPVLELVTLGRELRGLEIEVGRVRKQIKKL